MAGLAPTLTALQLQGDGRLKTDGLVAALAQLTNLQFLEVSWCRMAVDRSLPALIGLRLTQVG